MITPICFNTFTQYNNRDKFNSSQKKPNVTFCSRPEYDYFDKNYDVRASNYFRRGQSYGSPAREFIDVINAIKLVLSTENKPKILIAGVGEAQEPFSFLAVIKSLTKNKALESVVDLNCVDLQPKISNEELDNYAYLDVSLEPIFARTSFEYIENPTYKDYRNYKVKPDILDYLQEVFNNPEKTKWDTKIEEFSAICPKESYNMVSINNVLMYMKDEPTIKITMGNITEMLKKDGILVTDIYDDCYKKMFSSLENFKNLAPGIWQKMR